MPPISAADVLQIGYPNFKIVIFNNIKTLAEVSVRQFWCHPLGRWCQPPIKVDVLIGSDGFGSGIWEFGATHQLRVGVLIGSGAVKRSLDLVPPFRDG